MKAPTIKVRAPRRAIQEAQRRAAAIGWTLSAVVRELLALPWPMEKIRKPRAERSEL